MATRQTSKSLAVVLVHGAFADGSGWESVHGILRRDGYRAVVAQNPTISLAGDVDATKRVIAAQNGRVVLVGHSYGGAVITEAGHEPSVAVLVYIAAYAPDKGESVATLLEDSPPGAPLPPFLQPKDGYLLLDELEFPSAFAADVTAEKAAFMAAAQVPFGLEALNGRVGEPAWKVKPSWYLVATADRMIAPSVQRSMSRRARSTVVEASGSHAIHVSQPIVVAAFIEKAAALLAIGTLTLAAFPSSATADTPKGTTGRKETTMSTSTAVLEATTIQPFRVNVPEEQLADLRRRILATNWPEKETVPDGSQGVQLKTIQQLARYWATDYDWRKCEARLNAVPQFITEIDGLDIHYIHVRSKHKNAMPIIVTHGWPGSIVEQMKIIGPLTDPTAFGGRAEDAFDVVIPSMPGYGYSGRPTTTGWDCPHIARAWVVLMKRLGYTKFVAQGGDWGALVTEQMGLLAPPELLAIHTNMPGVFPNDINNAAFSGAPVPTGLSADEKLAYERLQFVYQKGIGYGYQLGLRPQTMYGIADSPVGLAAYFLDHDARSYELIARVFDGKTEGLTRDDILDNITVTWLTNTALSGARLYWESWGKIGYFNAKGIAIPVAVSVFPDELYPAPRSWAEQAFPNLIYFNKLDKGGHFAAWEQPALFSAEVRAAFRSVRQPGS